MNIANFCKSICYALIIALFFSCTKHDYYQENKLDTKSETIKLIAQIPSGETKTVIAGDAFNKINWTPKEKINVFYKGISYPFISTNEEDASLVEFEGVIDGIENNSQLDTTVIALYPFDANATINTEGVVSTTLSDVQYAVEDTFADSLFVSMGKIQGNLNDIYFYNVCSGLCFTVSHNDISSVSLRATNGVDLVGDFTVKFEIVGEKELPIVQSITNGKKVVTVYAPDGQNFIPGKRYYIATLPFEAEGIVIEGFREDGKVYQNEISKSVSFKRKIFARKLNFDEGLTPQELYDYFFNVIGPEDFYYKGEDREDAFSIESYRFLISDPSVKSPVKWSVQVLDDGSGNYINLSDDNKLWYGLDWLSFYTYSDIPDSYGAKSYGLVVGPSDGVDIPEAKTFHKQVLQNNIHPSGIDNSTKTNAIDLSMYDLEGNEISQTTANSYVVQSPGWYKLPMVYGNAIKNGTTNQGAYKPTTTYSLSLRNFIDHLGENITQPWVTSAHSGGAYDVVDAKILWQDEKNLVTNISIGNGGVENDYIYFYVDSDKITQGNAVIAAYVNGKSKIDAEVDSIYTAWNWHIWVTDVDFSNLDIVTNYEGITYEFFPCHLGWSTIGEQKKYDQREASVRIIQSMSNKTAPLKINQLEFQTRTEGNQPYYQWGRKDPFPPNLSNYVHLTEKTWYDANGAAHNSISWARFPLGIDCITMCIQNPEVFNNVNNMDQTYLNLWSALQPNTVLNNNVVVKTVYDPSPIGFTIPAPLAWTGFTTNGQDAQNKPENFNVDGSWVQGYYFWTDSKKRVSTYYPTSGMRYPGDSGTMYEGGKLLQVLTSGGARTTTCRNGYQSVYEFFFFQDRVMVRSWSSRGCGEAVRPVKEKI